MVSSIGSNNIELLLQSYRSLEERPIRRLETNRDSIDNRHSLFGDLKTKLRSLESITKELSYSSATSIYGTKAATVSDESFLTVSTTSAATVTSHSIEVNQLAKADKIISNQYTLSDTSLYSTLGTGTFDFEVTVNGETYQVSTTINENDDNETILNNISTAVNNVSGITVSASVIQDTEDTGRLVFTSDETGADYEMTLTDTTGTLLQTLGMDDSVAMSGTSGGYLYDSSELNSMIEVDGISIQRNTTTIEDAIEGVSITLLKPHQTGDTPLTVTVENDVESIKSKLQDFIDAYNQVVDFIGTNTNTNSATFERSPFSGDFTITNLKLELRNMLSQPVTGLTEGDPTILSEIGITANREGKLSISDSDTLDEYLQDNLDQVSALFNSTDGVANRLVDFMDPYTAGDGIIEQRRDALQDQINNINNRIDRMENLVDKRMESYRQQFAELQAAYNMYSSQSSYLSQLQQAGFM